jgi:hypothetical protein
VDFEHEDDLEVVEDYRETQKAEQNNELLNTIVERY